MYIKYVYTIMYICLHRHIDTVTTTITTASIHLTENDK